jgi:hypothetical protein
VWTARSDVSSDSADVVLGIADEDEDRQSAMNFLMHSADLSNPVRPFPLAKRWAYLIIDEFTQQGDMEKRLNLPVRFIHGVTPALGHVWFLFVICPSFFVRAESAVSRFS